MKSGRAAKGLETSELRIRFTVCFYRAKSKACWRLRPGAAYSQHRTQGLHAVNPSRRNRPRRISGSGFFHFYRRIFYRRIVAFKNQLTQDLSVLHFCLSTLAEAAFQLAMLAPGSVFSHAPGQ